MPAKHVHKIFSIEVAALLVRRVSETFPSERVLNAATSQVKQGKSRRSPDAQLHWIPERHPTVAIEVNHSADLGQLVCVKSPRFIIDSKHQTKTVIVFDLEYLKPKSKPTKSRPTTAPAALPVAGEQASVVSPASRPSVGYAAYSILRSSIEESGKQAITHSKWQPIRGEDKNLRGGSLHLSASDIYPSPVLAKHPHASVTITHEELLHILEVAEEVQGYVDSKPEVVEDDTDETELPKFNTPLRKRGFSVLSASSTSSPESELEKARQRKDRAFPGRPKPADDPSPVGIAKGRSKRAIIDYRSSDTAS